MRSINLGLFKSGFASTGSSVFLDAKLTWNWKTGEKKNLDNIIIKKKKKKAIKNQQNGKNCETYALHISVPAK